MQERQARREQLRLRLGLLSEQQWGGGGGTCLSAGGQSERNRRPGGSGYELVARGWLQHSERRATTRPSALFSAASRSFICRRAWTCFTWWRFCRRADRDEMGRSSGQRRAEREMEGCGAGRGRQNTDDCQAKEGWSASCFGGPKLVRSPWHLQNPALSKHHAKRSNPSADVSQFPLKLL